MELCAQDLKRLHRLFRGFAGGGEPRLGKADAKERGNHPLLAGKFDGRRLQGRKVVVDGEARDAEDRNAGKDREEDARPGTPLRPSLRIGREEPAGGKRPHGEALHEERKPRNDGKPRSREPADGKKRELPEARKRRGEHERVGGHRGEKRVQKRGAKGGQTARGRFHAARPAPAHEIVGRVVRRDADEAQAHDERDGVKRPEDGRASRPCRRARPPKRKGDRAARA